MPRRLTPLVTGEYYHVFNRSIHKAPIFTKSSVNKRFLKTISYYKYIKPSVRLSYFLSFGEDKKSDYKKMLFSSEKWVHILSYCLMSNHFHLLIQQKTDNGVSHFMQNIQNSFTRYNNTRFETDGPIFKGQFKAIRIEDDNQLLHVHRYIHLNPYSGFLLKSISDLEQFPFSSFPEYLDQCEGFCEKEIILSHFRSKNEYKKFIYDQADYQRTLEEIKHTTFE